MAKSSALERKIEKLLIAHCVCFEREKSFPDLKRGAYRYDFYIPNYMRVPVLVEIDGPAHFSASNKKFYPTRDKYLRAKGRDVRKNSYALEKGIPLFRIPYYEVENITHPKDLFNPTYLVRENYHEY